MMLPVTDARPKIHALSINAKAARRSIIFMLFPPPKDRYMLKLSRLAALLVAGAIVSAPAFSCRKGQGFRHRQWPADFPEHVYERLRRRAKGPGQRRIRRNCRSAVKEELIRREVLAQEAKKKGLDKNANVQGQIELAKQAVLIRAYLSGLRQGQPDQRSPAEGRIRR
jgi:peptidyl-prolyl cis-trans isomerase C